MNIDIKTSSINKDRLVDLNNEIVSFLYNYTKCNKCFGIPIVPYCYSKDDSVIFCLSCLENEKDFEKLNVKRENIPNFILKSLQEKIKFKCQNYSLGCKYVIGFDKAIDLFAHESSCDFTLIKCLNQDCKDMVMKKELNNHLDQCQFHSICKRCEDCEKKNLKVTCAKNCVSEQHNKTREKEVSDENIKRLREENDYLKEKINVIESQNQKIINCLENSLFCKEKYKYVKSDFYLSLFPIQTNLLEKTVNHFGSNSKESCEVYLNLGILYYNTSQYYNSTRYLNQYIETLLNQGTPSDSKEFIMPFYYLGMVSYYKYLDTKGMGKNSSENNKPLKDALKFIQDSLNLANIHQNEIEMCDCYNALGLIFEEFTNYQTSAEWHMKALEKRKKLYGEKNDNVTGDYYNNLGIVFNNLGKYKESIDYHVKALQIYKRTIGKCSYEIGNTYYNLGQAYINNKDLNKALKNFKNALKIYKKKELNRVDDISICLNKIGSIYLEKEMYILAYKNFKLALRKMKNTGSKLEKAKIYISIGLSLSSLKNYVLSNKYYIIAENILTKIDSNSDKMIGIYTSIGQNYYNSLQLEKSLEYYQKAESSIINSLGTESIELYKIYHDMSSISSNMEDYSQSIRLLNKALEIATNYKINEFEIADIHYYLGVAYSKLCNYTMGIENMKKCMKVYEEFKGKNDNGVASCLFRIGVNYMEMKKYEEAINNLNQSINIYKFNGPKNSVTELTECYIYLANSYCCMKDDESALDILRSAKKIFKDNNLRNTEIYEEIKTKWKEIRGKNYKKIEAKKYLNK